jgi:hypothetical protein
MRKISVTLLIAILAVSCFASIIGQVLAQSTTPTPSSTTNTPPAIRWMRYHGAVTQWGNTEYKGSITVNAKTALAPTPMFRPWVTVDAFWSNEPPFPATKPTGQGQYTFTHYNARLIMLQSIRKQNDMILNVTGLWNVNKIKITTDFDQSGAPVKTVREVTSIVNQAKGQLHITPDWKKFEIIIDGVDPLQGIQRSMMASTKIINPFSFGAGPTPSVKDLMQVMGSFRAIPGLANYVPELDYNKDSKIDLADLTTVAANMAK